MADARTRRFRWATLAGLGIGIGLGCTPTLDFLQCRNDDDCRNVAMVDLVCVSNTCVAPPDPLDSPCESNQECVDRFDEDHICGANSFCASLSTELCPKFVRPDDVDPDEIVWLGSILAVSPPFDEAIGPIENAVQLAVEDFDSVASLAGGKKVGWVGCDSRGDSEQAVQAARYLVDSIGVPAIVGPAFSGEMIEVVEQVAVDANVFVISPTATAKSITTLDDDGLAWRTISSDVYQAAALADRMALLDPPPNRVLVLAKQDLYGQQLLEDTSARLATVLPTAAVGTLFYPDPAGFDTEAELRSAYGQVIATGFEQNADTVLIIGTSEVRVLILSYLLALEGMPVATYPDFIVSHGAVPVLLSVVDEVDVNFKPILMGLLEGVSPQVQEPTTFDQFNIRYRITFSELEPLTAAALGYDAAMVTLLSMVSAGEMANDGVQIAQGVPNLVDGTPVPFVNGLDFIVAAVGELEAGNSIDITGVSGPLDFDLAGEVRSDLIGWDVVPRPGTTDVPTLSAARRYVLDPDQLTGEWMDIE